MEFIKVTASPHIKSSETTTKIMRDVIIALVPALIWGAYIYGPRAITLTAVSVISSVLFEYLYRKLLKKSNTVGDLSAAVSGVLLAMSLPVSAPLWMPVVGTFFATVIVKQLFGGLGKNVVNPAIAARIFLFISFPGEMVLYTEPGKRFSAFALSVDNAVDVTATATPLTYLKNGIIPEVSLSDLFVGNISGCIGEVSALALIAGGIYLLARKVISWHIPLSYLFTVAIITFAFPLNGADRLDYCLYHILSGAVMLGVFFMATDYVTSPVTKRGRIIFGIGCGAITVFIRYFGYPEGVSFAIMIMNCLVTYIDKAFRPVPFGKKKLKGEAK